MKFKERVENLLRDKPELRDNDKLLTYEVYKQIAEENGRFIFIPWDLFKKFPAFETIKRTRAKIQNKEGRYLPDSVEQIKIKKEKPREIIVIPDVKFKNSHLT
jgi:hypothetical protein